MARRPFIIINSHPVQYFAPLYRRMASDPTIRIKVLYCSKHGLNGELDKQFGTSVKWDIPLLEGYDHEFVANQSPQPSIYSFWGLLNFSLIRYLWKAPKSVVIVHGWGYAVCWLAIGSAKLFGHTVCMRAETPVQLEQRKSTRSQRLRKLLIGRGLFEFIDCFLYIGRRNRQFYEHMGIDEERLLFCPYVVDNDRFQKQAADLAPERTSLRQKLGLPIDAFVVLYCGKYITKKRPLDFIEAIHQLNEPKVVAVLMGDGALRGELERFITEHHMKNIFLTGFINQSAIGAYYATADVYVMCSTEEETWGLSINEAMNFSLPLVITQTIGCVDDLLLDGTNGYRVPCGAPEALAQALQKIVDLPFTDRINMGRQSLGQIELYSYEKIIDSLKLIPLPN